MAHAASWNWEFEGGAEVYSGHADGFARRAVVDRQVGAIHTDLAICRLAPGGFVGTHVHSFERCVYVLGGSPVVDIGDRSYCLEQGSYVLFPVGVPHAWRNGGRDEVRWLELSTPQPQQAEDGPEDTLFLNERARTDLPAVVPDLADPTVRWIGRYHGTPPQGEALRVDGPIRGRDPAGMDTALLAYSGISIKMLVDPTLGADLLTMFMVDYEPGGAAQIHDHPFEETYLFLEGEIEGDIDGKHQVFRAGEVLFCGVGEVHGFFNSSGGRVRWIETQAPQPPKRHSYRWPAYWQQLRQRLAAEEG